MRLMKSAHDLHQIDRPVMDSAAAPTTIDRHQQARAGGVGHVAIVEFVGRGRGWHTRTFAEHLRFCHRGENVPHRAERRGTFTLC